MVPDNHIGTPVGTAKSLGAIRVSKVARAYCAYESLY